MLIAIAGPIGSGKTTFSLALSEALGIPAFGFGDFVRSRAEVAAQPRDRLALQVFGQTLVDAGPAAFMSEFLDWTGRSAADDLIADGLRHLEVWRAMQELSSKAGTGAYLIFLEISETLRATRLGQRGQPLSAVDAADRHSSERDSRNALREGADLVIDASESAERLVARASATLRSRGDRTSASRVRPRRGGAEAPSDGRKPT